MCYDVFVGLRSYTNKKRCKHKLPFGVVRWRPHEFLFLFDRTVKRSDNEKTSEVWDDI